jgi:integrase/recombinase XerD
LPADLSGRVYVVGSVPVLHPEAQTVNEMREVGAVSNCAAT